MLLCAHTAESFNMLTGLIVLDQHLTFDSEASECVYYLQSCNMQLQ